MTMYWTINMESPSSWTCGECAKYIYCDDPKGLKNLIDEHIQEHVSANKQSDVIQYTELDRIRAHGLGVSLVYSENE